MDAAHDITAGGHIPVLDMKRRLRLAREDAGLEQTELANLLGISPRSIHNYEKGYTVPKKPVLLHWAISTGVPLAWLAEGIDTEVTPTPCPSCGLPAGQDHQGPEGPQTAQNRCVSLNAEVIDLATRR